MEVSAVKKNPAHCLGSGAKGSVFQGFNENTGQLVAIKEMILPGGSSPDHHEALVKEVANEIDLMKRLDHPHLVQYYGVCRSEENPQAIQIILEYVSGGSLGAIIKKYGRLREAVARQYTKDIFVALDYLHRTCKVCHRDIKPENILLSPEGKCKIADFGASKILNNNTSLLKSCVGTPWYMAPEVIQGEGYNELSDIWSAGCTVYEMLVGRPPFHDVSNPMAVMFKVASNENMKPELPSDVHVSEECRQFLEMCFSRNPQNRSSAAQLLRHPWITAMKVPPKQSLFGGPIGGSKSATAGGGEKAEDKNNSGVTPLDADELDDVEAVGNDTDSSNGGAESPQQTAQQPADANAPAEGAEENNNNDLMDFFPGKSKGDEFDFTRMCQKCNKQVAVFSCDECRPRGTPHQLCPGCWNTTHAHPRAASHMRAPLLLPAHGVPPAERSAKLQQEKLHAARGGGFTVQSPTLNKASTLSHSVSPMAQNLNQSGQGQFHSATSPLVASISGANLSGMSSGSYPQQLLVYPTMAPSQPGGAASLSNQGGVLLANGDFVDLYEGEQSEWECGKCTYLNDGPAKDCQMCGHER